MIHRQITLHSDFKSVGRIPPFPEEAIREEPALRGCPVAWALEHGGPIMQTFVKALPEDWLADPSTRIRCKTAFLRKGWSCGHAGWHLDGITSREDGEEDWLDGRPPGFERISCNMGTNAPTRVVVGDLIFPAYPLGQPLLSLCHQHVEEAVATGKVRVANPEEGEIFILNSSSMHTASPASRDGWRMFFDANRDTPGLPSFPPVEDCYAEIYCEYQADSARMESLMAHYQPAVPRCLLP